MPFRIIEHYPNINETDIPRNAPVKIHFTSGVIPSTVTYNHFSVNDAATFSTVAGTLGVEYNASGIPNIATFTPLINYTANNKYKVFVFGTPNSILSTANQSLASTYSYEFTTGGSLITGTIPPGLPSGNVTISGYTPVDSGDITSFYVVATDPQNQEPNVETNTDICITFNTDIDTTDSQMSGYVTITSNDVLY